MSILGSFGWRREGQLSLRHRHEARTQGPGNAAMRAIPHRGLFVLLVCALVALAWATLWVWEQSPYGRYLNHAELGEIALGADASRIGMLAGFYVAGWTLMTVAMMLPTTLPLIEVFRRLTRRRENQTQLLTLLVLGYLGAWLAFGVAAHVFDLGLHLAFDRSAWLQANTWIFGAGPLMVAGAFQFSRLKYRCLDKCRSPFSFVMEHWRGGRERKDSFLLGLHHGAFCVGCCWALMLLMFAVGTGNVGWMLMLGAVMAIERNMPWGRSLSAPLGVALLAWGGLIAFNHTWSWQI